VNSGIAQKGEAMKPPGGTKYATAQRPVLPEPTASLVSAIRPRSQGKEPEAKIQCNLILPLTDRILEIVFARNATIDNGIARTEQEPGGPLASWLIEDSEETLLDIHGPLWLMPAPHDLSVVETQELAIVSQNGMKLAIFPFDSKSTAGDLERHRSGQFADCKDAAFSGLALPSNAQLAAFEAVVSAVPKSSQGTLDVQLGGEETTGNSENG
jgi:hypothetical protein